MSLTLLLPLQPYPVRFTVRMADRGLVMATQYRDGLNGCWILDIDDDDAQVPLIHGIPLVTGIDLLEPWHYLLDGSLYVIDDNGKDAPGFEDLGVSAQLYYVTP